MILQAAMDNTIEQLSDAQQVQLSFFNKKRSFSFHFLQNQGLADETANAQIDTLILDNRKKLNQIIGEDFMRCLIIF